IVHVVIISLFFFQAEDGIRDRNVTGVQTCALPIWPVPLNLPPYCPHPHPHKRRERAGRPVRMQRVHTYAFRAPSLRIWSAAAEGCGGDLNRSEPPRFRTQTTVLEFEPQSQSRVEKKKITI